jgi:valyl-tRNA synthetase
MLEKTFDPKTAEPRLYAAWEASGAFAPTDDPAAEPFSIVIPPPNVTGSLHIGHALNNTLQDVLIRFERMRGKAALWLPGHRPRGHRHPDGGGAPARRSRQPEPPRHGPRGLRRQGLGVEGQVGRRDRQPAAPPGRLLRLEPRALHPGRGPVGAVRKVFVDPLQGEADLPRQAAGELGPALPDRDLDLEVEQREVDGHYWHFAYPLEDGSGEIVVATTRPETMLADTAVAVHPTTSATRPVVGKAVRLPIVNRPIPIIADEYPDPRRAPAR